MLLRSCHVRRACTPECAIDHARFSHAGRQGAVEGRIKRRRSVRRYAVLTYLCPTWQDPARLWEEMKLSATDTITAREPREPVVPGWVREIGGMADMAFRTVRTGLRPPYSWAPEFVSQLRFTIKVCFFPLVLTSFALSFGPAGIQASNFFGLVRRDRPAGRRLRDHRRAHVRAARLGDRAGGRGGDGDLRRPRRAAGARGDRGAAGARRRPGQAASSSRACSRSSSRRSCSTSSRCWPGCSAWSSSCSRTAARSAPSSPRSSPTRPRSSCRRRC